MSVLIDGMEMPKDIEPGLVIEFADGIDGKRYARLYHYRHGGLTEWHEAVPVPPHGDLIDRAELWVEINKICDRRDAGIITDLTCLQQILSALRHAPTIIPADPLLPNTPVNHGSCGATTKEEAMKMLGLEPNKEEANT